MENIQSKFDLSQVKDGEYRTNKNQPINIRIIVALFSKIWYIKGKLLIEHINAMVIRGIEKLWNFETGLYPVIKVWKI